MEYGLTDAAAIPVISGWVMKAKDFLPEEWYKKGLPILAILCGIIYSFALREPAGDVYQTIAMGISVGLGSIGAHSATKNVVEKINGDPA
jgi:hypothetical protein